MKAVPFLCAIVGAVASVTLPAHGQYTLEAVAIDGGGGTSSGGSYVLSGTMGQPAAGTLAGGNYVVQSGFWSILATPEPSDPPVLQIDVSGPTVILSWPDPYASFHLQESSSLSSPSWTDVDAIPDTAAGRFEVPRSAIGTARYYRLIRP
jgi:hypothetical protein